MGSIGHSSSSPSRAKSEGSPEFISSDDGGDASNEAVNFSWFGTKLRRSFHDVFDGIDTLRFDEDVEEVSRVRPLQRLLEYLSHHYDSSQTIAAASSTISSTDSDACLANDQLNQSSKFREFYAILRACILNESAACCLSLCYQKMQ
ncbi:hypothetical protein Q3G72_024208 [Acer saccharum]|nr:hypothetical protein Q3G72_024208 [Acer saccharum]